MKQKGFLITTVLLMSTLALAGCSSGQSKSTKPTSHLKTTSIAKSKSKNKSESSVTTDKKSTALWDSKKDDQLKSFIDQWAPTMQQSYVKYDGVHSITLPTDITYPDYLPKVTVEGTNSSIGWSKDGKNKYTYNVVAIYNYDNKRPPMEGHITYFFAFKDGQPIALVDQSTNGTPNLTETQNTKVRDAFAQIASGNSATSTSTDDTTKSTTQNDSQAVTDPKMIGIMVRELARPGGDLNAESDVLGVYTANGKYWIGTGTSSSNVGYTINGDTIHYFTKDYSGGASTADAPLIDHSISLSDLQKQYYSTADQKQTVQSLANKMPAIEND